MAARLLDVYYNTDIRDLLPRGPRAALVLHREADRGTPFELGREVAALIPGATLIPLPVPATSSTTVTGRLWRRRWSIFWPNGRASSPAHAA